jgi:subtilisin family serine protease
MDPRLQQFADRRRRGINTVATESTDAGEIAVVAKVNDLDAWRAMSEVREGAVLGVGTNAGEWLVTARIPLSRLESVRLADPVISLKAAQGIKPALSATIEEIESRSDLLPSGALGQQGTGVVVGIVDFGGDVAHQNFRQAGGATRLLALWDQSGPVRPTSPFGYGRLYSSAEINQALLTPDPYVTLGYRPARRSHGTHVMDIAAGNGRGSGTTGVAPNADLVFVELAASDIPWGSPDVVGSTFGDSVQLLEAMRFIFDLAGTRPCVINLSLGTNGGPHDGTTLVEQGIDAMLHEAPNRAVVIAASNSFDDGIHAGGAVPANGHVDLSWNVPAQDFTHNELEVWYKAGDEFRLEILLPNGTSLGSVALGENARVNDDDGKTLIFAAHRRQDPNNGDNVIGVFLESGLPAGTWTMRLHGVAVADGRFHAWVERDDRSPSQFAPPHDGSSTLGSISCSRASIAVGSYDGHKPNLPLSFFSSAGPTRDGSEKPEVSAPGHAVMAADSGTGVGVVRMSGTSMAAPAVTGVVALLLAEAAERGISLTAEQIREVLVDTARRSPPAGTAWHDRFGAGRVHAKGAVAAVQAMTRPGTDGTGRHRRRRGAARGSDATRTSTRG